MHQQVAAEDALEMAYILNAERENVEWIIEEEQTHKAQVAAFFTDAAPGIAFGGKIRKGAVDTQCCVGGAPDNFTIFT